MPSSRFLIASNTLTSSAASVTFSSIPSTYTDLVLKISARDNDAGQENDILVTFNSNTSNYSWTRLLGNGATASSSRSTVTRYFGSSNGGGTTSNTFSNVEIYIPSYQASQNKPVSTYSITENNGTTAYIKALANLWSNTSAITSILIEATPSLSFVSGSSFWLYGLKNS